MGHATVEADWWVMIGRHLDGRFLETEADAPAERILDQPPTGDPVPSTEVVLEDLLRSLGGQLGQPFPARKRIDPGGAELAVDVRDRRTPSDAAVAAGIPLV
jgi:hypothetical protein